MSAALYVERGPRGKWRSLPEPDYLRLLAEQDGHCALCPSTPKARRLHTDHDHKTGRVRGLLCHRCNRTLPAWVSAAWLIRAAEYLGGSPRAEAGKLREERDIARAADDGALEAIMALEDEAGKLRAALEAALHVAHCAVSALEGAEATEESVEQNDQTAEWARREVTRLAALVGSDAPPTLSEGDALCACHRYSYCNCDGSLSAAAVPAIEACDGSSACRATVHVHGCFAERAAAVPAERET